MNIGLVGRTLMKRYSISRKKLRKSKEALDSFRLISRINNCLLDR